MKSDLCECGHKLEEHVEDGIGCMGPLFTPSAFCPCLSFEPYKSNHQRDR